MEGETWGFNDIFNTSDSQSVCSASTSEGSLVKLSDVNIINHNPWKRNIDDQLKIIRKEKHKEYLHNAGHKSLSLKNNKTNENSKQCNDLQDRNVDKYGPKETNYQSHWPLGTCTIVGDSMVNGIDVNAKFFYFSGAIIEEINQ